MTTQEILEQIRNKWCKGCGGDCVECTIHYDYSMECLIEDILEISKNNA